MLAELGGCRKCLRGRNRTGAVEKRAALTEQICAMFDFAKNKVAEMNQRQCSSVCRQLSESAQACKLCPSVCGTEVATQSDRRSEGCDNMNISRTDKHSLNNMESVFVMSTSQYPGNKSFSVTVENFPQV